MKNVKLDKDEQKILKAVENGDYAPVKNKNQLMKKFVKAAENTMKKNKNITIRISEKDLTNLKKKALESGIPYQTLIGSLIRNYADGKIKISI